MEKIPVSEKIQPVKNIVEALDGNLIDALKDLKLTVLETMALKDPKQAVELVKTLCPFAALMLKKKKETAEEQARQYQAMMDDLKLIYQCDFDKLSDLELYTNPTMMTAIYNITKLESLLTDKKSESLLNDKKSD
jgi:hypothetical protein